ncbi:acetate--CoA ligase family protein [Dactylosporangium sp. NBC_01737]|uniref:bifunctional acetate--CoA ligase family protein/GNAT family N-acetyltransferase n=1 Tax=Dactylosporangium sp. NBC_01737 TaxID=2975959 RepID=UPI002E1169CD|nr:acetate--CoA ligase family protein [Dactylosporangium sp. NBC_01737]
MNAGPAAPADCLTADGRVVRVRAVTAADMPALLALHEGTSAQNRYLRFFSAGAGLDAEVRRLTRPADEQHLALLVEHGDEVLAAGSYERVSTSEADFALLVHDAHHGEGLGTLLLEHLAAAARRQGVTALIGDVLAGNGAMLRVSRGVAPGVPRTSSDPGIVQVRIPTLPDEAALAAVDERDRTAEYQSLRPLLAPTSVVVIGAGRQPGGAGHEVLAALIAGRYDGELFAVNPRARNVCGLPALPSVALVGEQIDLAIVAVPGKAALDVLRDCCAAGVRAAVVLTSDLDEPVRTELVRMARRHGMRLVGPDSLGVLNTDPKVRLTATFAAALPPAGGLAVASQSGAIGVAILEAAARDGVGVSSFVSLGDKADVSGNDLLAYWHDDPATQAVALYLESFGNPRRFATVARAISRRKPVLAVKSGRHAAAASDSAVDALFRQAGVIRTDTLGELLDTARVLVGQPLPAGGRLAVVGNARGLNVLAADTATAAGLTLATFGAATTDRLRRLIPDGQDHGNPVDLGTAGTAESIAGAVRLVAASGEADLLVVTFAATRTNDSTATLRALAAAADAVPDLPVAVVAVGVPDTPAALGRRKVPVYQLPEPAVHALGRAVQYAAWQRAPLGGRPVLPGVDAAAARDIVGTALRGGGGWQPAGIARQLLRAYGIPVLDAHLADGVAAAVAVAAGLGYPVAVTAAAPGQRPGGAVRLGLVDAAAVRHACHLIGASLGEDDPAVMVERMASPGVELRAGITHDPLFGSLVTVGVGGPAELHGEPVLRLLPVTDQDAATMWRSLRSAPLLTGHAGDAPADTDALENLLLRLGRLAVDLPDVAELALDPVLAGPSGCVAVDVRLRLSAVGSEPDPYLRDLLHRPSINGNREPNQ